MELQLNEQFFKKNFDVRLGARADECTDEGELAGAIPEIWAMDLEREATEKLWWEKFTGKALDDGVIRKDELITKPGDRININRISQLTNEGHLGLTHLLESDEEKLALGQVIFTPDRWGNAVCWPYYVGNKVVFNLRPETKNILADWMATTLDTIVWTAAVASTNVIFGGTATSRMTLTDTDTFGAHELKRLSVLLEENKAKVVRGITGSYVCFIHPRQKYDLLNDADWVAAARYEGSSKLFKAYIGTYMDIDVFTTGQTPSVDSGGSPGVTVYQAVAFGARSLGIAYGTPITWREKISSYQESFGIGTDVFVDAKILNQDYLYVCETAGTNPTTS